MNKAFKCALAVFLLAVFSSAVPAFASLPEPGVGAAYYVQDEANVLTSETEEQIVNYNIDLELACDGAQLAVVTVNYLDEDADVAATKLLNDRGVGSATQSNGMLLLLVAKEARGGVTAGDGIDEAFYDSFSEKYYDDFWDDVDAGRFDDAVRELTGHIYDWYMDYYDVSTSLSAQDGAQYGDVYYEQPAQSSRSGVSGFVGVVFLFILVVLIIWVIGAASRFTRMRSWGYTGRFFPIFWFGGTRRYRDWYRRQPPPPPPGGFGGGPGPGPRPSAPSTFNRTVRTRSSGFRSSGAGRSSGFRSGGSFHGGGFGGHGGGGFRGRR